MSNCTTLSVQRIVNFSLARHEQSVVGENNVVQSAPGLRLVVLLLVVGSTLLFSSTTTLF